MAPPREQVALDLPMDRLADFCRRWKFHKLEVFGSAVRDELRADSDLDLLYTLEPDAHWGLAFMDAWDELEGIVGRPVDLLSRRAIERSSNARRREAILGSARTLYAA